MDPLVNNPIYQKFTQGDPITYESPLGFACRGCGPLCCVNTEVMVTPPEAARIIWYLDRHPKLADALRRENIRWGAMILGGSTGLPLVLLNFIPFKEDSPDDGRRCLFLAPVYGGDPAGPHWLGMAWCAIREARPGPCRIFPLGRVIAGPKADVNDPARWEYRIVARCPGFEPAAPDEPTPPGYAPPTPSQTVRHWVAQQLDSDQEMEKNFYMMQVVSAYMQRRLHAPTDDSPDGRLPEGAALALGRLFYAPPPAPADPADDHSVIMHWLASLAEQAPALEAALMDMPARARAGQRVEAG